MIQYIHKLVACICLIAMYVHTMAQGPDVKPADIPQHRQIEAEVDVAFNGWIYEAHSYADAIFRDTGVWVSLSKDAGRTWETIVIFSGPGVAIPEFDIVVAGQDTNNLKLYIARTYHDLQSDVNVLFVTRHNAVNGANEATLLSRNLGTRQIYDLKLASDYMFPAVGAQPYSVMCAYTCQGAVRDSLHAFISADGGTSFGALQRVTATPQKLNKLAIGYGYSPAASNGRYFLAWEQFSSPTDTLGHIYTSRHSTNISLGFTAPFNLDSLHVSAIGKCRNPTIAVSHTYEDNDSASVTALVIAEYDNSANNKGYELAGFYNKKAHSTSYWNVFDFATFSNNNQAQPCLAFDTLNHLFMLTFYDDEGGRMTHFAKAMNMPSPANWSVFTANYTDEGVGHALPYPKLAFNAAMRNAVYVWTHKAEGANTNILFDAGYRYTGGGYIDTTICEGTVLTFNGLAITSEGTYYDTVAIPLGDSIIELWVGIDSLPEPTIMQSGNVLSTESFVDYQWQLEGNDIALANNQNYTVTANGNYTVVVTGNNGCSGTSSTININSVGITNTGPANFSIYPNPVSNNLVIELYANRNADIYITDLQGKQLLKAEIQDNATLDLSTLLQGIYILQIADEKGETYNTRFTKL